MRRTNASRALQHRPEEDSLTAWYEFCTENGTAELLLGYARITIAHYQGHRHRIHLLQQEQSEQGQGKGKCYRLVAAESRPPLRLLLLLLLLLLRLLLLLLHAATVSPATGISGHR
jgi:hypothetical protein